MMTVKEWVDENITHYQNTPEVTLEMLDAMRGSMTKDAWIDEAIKYTKDTYYNVSPYLANTRRVNKSPFDVNWADLDDVKDYASQLGPGMVVAKNRHPDYEGQFVICHAARHDRYVVTDVLYRT